MDNESRLSDGEARRLRIARRARSIVRREYIDPDRCNTRAIAGRIGVSRARVCRCYREAYDTTIGQEIRALRIDLARRLLAQKPDRLIKEIAAEAGYGNHSYRTFLNSFQQEVGVSPREYRRMLEREREPQRALQSRTFSA